MSNELFMLSRFIDLYCNSSPEHNRFYDYSYGGISINITDEGYVYSHDDDVESIEYPLTTVSQLRALFEVEDSVV